VLFFRKANVEKSTEYLTKYLEKVADKDGDNQYAKACSALGFIHNTLVNIKIVLSLLNIPLFFSIESL
jgi:hypothetical protein